MASSSWSAITALAEDTDMSPEEFQQMFFADCSPLTEQEAKSNRAPVTAVTNTDMSPQEFERLLCADSSTLTQQERDKRRNTTVHFDLDHLVDQLNRARTRGGDNTVVMNLFTRPSAMPKACSKKCSGPATKR